MEVLLFLLFLSACHGLAIEIPKTQQLNIQAPDFKTFEAIDDQNNITYHEIISWTSVESGDASDPVIGYKLKVWEIRKINTTKYETQGDELVSVVKERYPNIDAIPDGVPKEIETPASETTATFYDMHVDVAYQFAVLAFTARGEGPLSDPVRMRRRHIDLTKKEA